MDRVARIGMGRAAAILAGVLVAGLFALAYVSYQRAIGHARERKR